MSCYVADSVLITLLKVILDEQTLDVLVNYTTAALKVCSTWTHSDILLALSAVVYYKGPQCQQVDNCTSFLTFTVCDNYCVSICLLYTHSFSVTC